MSKNIEHLQHIKSSVVIEGKPKLPTAEVLIEGELAVNYAEGYETISLRNSSSGITTFSSDDYYTKKKLGSGFTGANSANTVTSVIEGNEEIMVYALNDLDERKLDASAYTPTDLSNYYTKDETSGKTEIANALQTKSNANHNQASNTITAMTSYAIASTSGNITTSDTLNAAIGKLERNDNDIKKQIGSGFTVSSITEVIEENEEIISSSLNDLNKRVGGKADASDLDAIRKTISDLETQMEVISSALNDLNWRLAKLEN